MGQQQLLLLVLGVIIVGVAVVAGIGMFQAGAEESVKDEISAQLMAIGANAQQYFKKPQSMDGGGGDFTGYAIPVRMQFTENCGDGDVALDGTVTVNTAGYVITATAAGQVTITASPDAALNYGWVGTALVSPFSVQLDIAEPAP